MDKNVIEKVLKELNILYIKEYNFDITGMRKYKYDFACFNHKSDKMPKLLIECDNVNHFTDDYYFSVDAFATTERSKEHLVRNQLVDAKKDFNANLLGVYVLRINEAWNNYIEELIKSYIKIFLM